MSQEKDSIPVHCSFCGKENSEVRRLIDGSQGIYICDGCVALASEILAEEGLANDPTQDDQPVNVENRVPNPKEIHEYLDQYVIGQDQAKKVLAVAVYNHYKRVFGVQNTPKSVDIPEDLQSDEIELAKSNVLLVGPTGSGKTLLAQTLAKLLDVPFTIGDATSLTEAGYVGEDVESILVGLLQAADWDTERAAYGIIYIDEIDKVARKTGDNPSITRDVSGEGVQQALLKIIEGTIANVPQGSGRKHPQQEFVQLDTNNILFICGGAFAGLPDVVRRRVKGRSNLGFVSKEESMTLVQQTIKESLEEPEALPLPDDLTEREREMKIRRLETENREDSYYLRQVIPDDLRGYGLIPEFIGRIPVFVSLAALDRQAMVRILTEPKNSVIRQFQRLFAMDQTLLSFDEGALDVIATEAFLRKTGARGLRSIVEQTLLDVMFEIPGRDDITRCVVTKEVFTEGEQPLLYNKQDQLISLYPETYQAAA